MRQSWRLKQMRQESSIRACLFIKYYRAGLLVSGGGTSRQHAKLAAGAQAEFVERAGCVCAAVVQQARGQARLVQQQPVGSAQVVHPLQRAHLQWASG